MNLNSLHLSRTTAVGIILAIIIGGAIWYTMSKEDTEDDIIVESDPASTASEANFVTLASELDSISFDTSVLSDMRLLSLMNIHTAITPEPQGRTDPFSSI